MSRWVGHCLQLSDNSGSYDIMDEHGMATNPRSLSGRGLNPKFDISASSFTNPGMLYSTSYQSAHYHNNQRFQPPIYGQFFHPIPQSSLTVPSSLDLTHTSQPSQQSLEPKDYTPAPGFSTPPSSTRAQRMPLVLESLTLRPGSSISHSDRAGFQTDVDTLVKTIQAQSIQAQSIPESDSETIVENLPSSKTLGGCKSFVPGGQEEEEEEEEEEAKPQAVIRKRYQCQVAACSKCFFQKTHLEIHLRAHTGIKPFVSTCCCSASRLLTPYSYVKSRTVVKDFRSWGISRSALDDVPLNVLIEPLDPWAAAHRRKTLCVRWLRQAFCSARQCPSSSYRSRAHQAIQLQTG